MLPTRDGLFPSTEEAVAVLLSAIFGEVQVSLPLFANPYTATKFENEETYNFPLATTGEQNLAYLPILSPGTIVEFQSSFVTSLALTARTIPGQTWWFGSQLLACVTQRMAVLSTLPLELVLMLAPLWPMGPWIPLVTTFATVRLPAVRFTGQAFNAVFSGQV